MADNHVPEVRLNEDQGGTVSFATDVVATIAGLAANEVEGVAGMQAIAPCFSDMLSRKNTRNYTRGVKVEVDKGKVSVDVNIIVEYGSPVPDVARSIQENVKKAIETMSGLEVTHVDVHVQSISFQREIKAAAELDEQQKQFLNRADSTEDSTEPEASAGTGDEEDPGEEYELDLPEEEEAEPAETKEVSE